MDQQLEVFLSVVDNKNFSRAADELHMTQPAVSQYIRTLEEKLGVRLLDRTNKYVRVTKAGEIVYHHSKEIVGLYTKMGSLLDDLTNQVKGPLSIGASYTYGEYVLPHLIAKMKKQYPDIEPKVTIGNTVKIAELVKSHQIDIGIIEGPLKKEKQIEIRDFAEDHMVIIASLNHPLVRKNGEVTITDLEDEAWILREEGSGTREAGESVFKQLHISPKNIMTFGSTQAIKEAVEAGLGISILSQLVVKKEIKHGNLKIVDFPGLPYIRKFSFITNSPFQTKALQEFITLLGTGGTVPLVPLEIPEN
ncbi:LysR family transcriptional regulator [Fredinandcohnia sp. QZ13]|uniref:LysR family transcriptional regulator n=1 Tax=Fredinandcohnia sp. QZ13 TaxID=3073144 RepID=UPI0028535F03|nr:LysR family transcriptional regulator [Fredinandcohnia sp. QZ13]MDR4887317.1 LysR family transcriptional regulator [Fredinandcohnia sp. QZ13]